MIHFRDLPIRRKAAALILVASVIALILSVGAILLYEVTTVRPRVVADLHSQADLLEANSVAALRFRDRIAATQDLSTLQAKNDIAAAALYDARGRLFANWQRSADGEDRKPIANQVRIPESRPDPDTDPSGPFVTINRPVAADGEALGSLVIWYELPSLLTRLPQYGLIIGLVLVTLLVVSALLLGLLRTRLVRPLIALSDTASAITERRDYSLRATQHGSDEVGVLTGSFNAMLETIEERDASLRESSNRLQLAMSDQQRQAERLAEALDAARMASYTWNPATDRLTWGEEELGLFGEITPKEAILTGFLTRIDEDFRQPLKQAMTDATRSGEPFEHAFRMTPAEDGRTSWYTIRGRAAPAENGRIDVVGLVQDVTERRHLEEQLQQSQKMEAVGRLAGGIAHDFNNLLTAINGYASLALKRLTPSTQEAEYVSEVKRAGERAADLTRQLLAFSRRQMLQPTILSLNDLLGSLVKLLGHLLGENIKLRLDLDPDCGNVRVDRASMEQVMVNLAVNARDAMPSGGWLTFETSRIRITSADTDQTENLPPGDYIRLTVSDTGTGMEPEILKHVFEPFFTTKEVGKGTGLGLAMVHGTIKQSNGGVDVTSTPGRGTSFRVHLPHIPPEARELEPRATPVPVGSETVLLVEDDPAVLGLARGSLEAQGYRVLSASSAQEANAMLASGNGACLRSLDLMVTDVVMPGQSGRSLAEELHIRRPDLRVLYISGHTDDQVIAHGVHESSTWFLQKPFSPEDLARKVRAVLDS